MRVIDQFPHHKTRSLGTRQRIRLSMIVVASVLALAACGSADGRGSDSGDIVIGLNLEMSGPGSFLGEGMKAGIEAAAKKINEDGGIDGRMIKIVAKDNESDPAKAVSLVSELKRDGADVILGPGFAADCAAAAPTLAREDIVGFCMSAGDLPDDDSHMFGVGVDYTTIESALAEQFDDEGAQHLGLVSASDTSGDLTVEIFEPAASSVGVQVDVERFNSPTNDLTAQLLSVNRQSPEAIRLQATGPDALVGIANVKALGITVPVWLPNSNASLYFADHAKEDVEAGNICTWIPALLSPTGTEDYPKQAEQIEALKAALPQADTVTAAGWDAMQIAAAGIEKAGGTDTSDLIDALESMDKYYGAYSVQQITADDHRGATEEGTLLPARFTADGTFELVDGS